MPGYPWEHLQSGTAGFYKLNALYATQQLNSNSTKVTFHSQIAPFVPPTPKSENPKLERNMEWIGCTICEIFAFKLYCDLETGVRGHSRSSKAALFDRAHTTLYSSSIVTMPLSITVSEIQRYTGRKLLPPCIWRPRWGEAVRIVQQTLVMKN